jgi:uncharacterized protein (TIGR02996 family)
VTTSQLAEREGLLRAVIEAPADDGPRLVYADWLEDNGEPERAEFIRIQIAMHRHETAPAINVNTYIVRSRRLMMTGRVAELLDSHGYFWVNDPREWPISMVLGKDCVTFRRGFVEEWRMRLADWLDHGPVLVKRHPLARMEVTDRRAHHNAAGCFLWEMAIDVGVEGSHFLPESIYRRLKGWVYDPHCGWCRAYRTRVEAVNALSDACLAHAAG